MSEDDHENQAPDNLENIKSEYHYIYKEIQGSIKDKVISKFLSTIQQQSKELIELKKENTMLKNQLIIFQIMMNIIIIIIIIKKIFHKMNHIDNIKFINMYLLLKIYLINQIFIKLGQIIIFIKKKNSFNNSMRKTKNYLIISKEYDDIEDE